jgi:pilus assembly protein CpaF
VTSPHSSLIRTLSDRVVHTAGQPGGDTLDAVVQREVAQHSEAALGAEGWDSGTEAELVQAVGTSLSGLGPLQEFLDDPDVEEIWINAPHAVFVARLGVSEKVDLILTAEEVRDLVERMLRPTGRRVDVSQPFVDASLADGSRVHVVIPDITKTHWSINIRKFSKRVRNLSDLVERDVLSAEAATFLTHAVRSGQTFLVSGATQAGKTTMLQTLLREAPPCERVVSVEETFELDLAIPDHVGLQCRGPSLEGTGEVTLRRLVKEALRMRPDRIVVGEVREAEALDLLIALNSGLPGACTIHARSGADALSKLCTLPLLAGGNIDRSFVVPTVASVIDLVVHVELHPSGRRQVREIVSPTGVDTRGDVTSQARFVRHGGTLREVPQ